MEATLSRLKRTAREGTKARGPSLICIVLGISVLLTPSCSIRKMAADSLANTLAAGGMDAFSSDEDPELVGDALPTALKVMELLIQSSPGNKNLLTATASGFVQYGHAYVLHPADALEHEDLQAARRERQRAKMLFLRARDYGLKALEVAYPDISLGLRSGSPGEALRKTRSTDIASLYWTGAAWGSAISISKDDTRLLGDIGIVTAIMERALALDESWNNGAIHEFFVPFSKANPDTGTDSVARAEEHFRRAMMLNAGKSIAPLVSLAESVCVMQQDRSRFTRLLNEALAFDADKHVEFRLSNILAQRKAARLLGNIDGLFY